MNRRPARLLLLNPPFVRQVSRDCYCSNPAKSPMLPHPLDLQIQSGFFDSAEFELSFIDAIFARQSPDQTLDAIKTFTPDLVFSLVGALSLESDSLFFRRMKAALPNVRLFLSGDVAKFDPNMLSEKIPEAEGLLLDFTSPALFDYVRTGDSCSSDFYLPAKGAIQQSAHVKARGMAYPLPWVGFVTRYSYQLPFFSDPHCYSILASFGCPHQCAYCNVHILGYKARENEAFLEELAYAAHLGFKSLYVRDATFGVNREQTLSLLKAWSQTHLSFEWMCFARPDHLDEEMIAWASRLGCRLMMLGVESFDETWLQDVSKGMVIATVKETFRLLRKYGIRSAALMMVGMDHGNVTSPAAIIRYEQRLKRFLTELDPDYISLNVFSRRPGVETQDLVVRHVESNRPAYESLAARVNRAFYFKPRTLLRQSSLLRTPAQLALWLRIAANLLRN